MAINKRGKMQLILVEIIHRENDLSLCRKELFTPRKNFYVVCPFICGQIIPDFVWEFNELVFLANTLMIISKASSILSKNTTQSPLTIWPKRLP